MAKALRITSKQEGFRRAGIAHSTQATVHPIDKFSKDQVATLKADPMLVVEEVETNEGKGK